MAKSTSKRKPISNSIRFEVFKRDCFSCQYCGRKAPDVLLHVDHIHPVCEGGDNNIVNLITACVECNSGKRGKRLDDTDKIQKQYAGALDAGAKAKQIRMVAKARRDLVRAQQEAVEVACSVWQGLICAELYSSEVKKITACVNKYPLEMVIQGIEYTYRRNVDKQFGSRRDGMNWLIPAIMFLMKPEHERECARIKGLVRRKFGVNLVGDWTDYLCVIIKADYDIEAYIDGASSFDEFSADMGKVRGWIDSENGAD
jgi:hypothetical protein